MTTTHVHVINDPSLDADQFHVSEPLFRAAVASRPELRDRVRVTFSDDVHGVDDGAVDADVLLGWAFPRDAGDVMPNLRWVHVIGAGTEHLQPLDWLPEGAKLTNSSGVHAARAGDYIACALLLFSNLLHVHIESQAKRRWDARYATTIAGKTVVIVGVGTIGGEGARRAKQLGLHVRGVRRSGEPHPDVDEMYAPAEIDDALRGADFVVVTAALTPETHGLLDRARLDLLPEHAGIVNMARAQIVDYDALEACLRAGTLGGAMLDVFDPEPLPSTSSLWTCPRLIITPHVSSDPLDYTAGMLDIFVDNLVRHASGTPLRNEVPLDRGY